MIKINKKGFTLVELLTIIIILGILMTVAIPSVTTLIEKSKRENKESQRNTLQMAAESYLQNNTDKLPKNIGQNILVTAKELREKNYLKEDIYDANKKSCMKDSVVRVYKYDKDKYTYNAYLFCEGDKVPTTIEGVKPNIKINFTDGHNEITNISQNNVTTAIVGVKYDGNKTSDGKKLGIDGYNYVVSVQYEGDSKYVEIYNSGSLNAHGRENFEIRKNITEYIDITRATNIRVTAEAFNRDGGHTKITVDSAYKDNKKPICGTTKGEPREDEWNNKLRSRTITIKCSDGDGSGCVRDTFTKTFTNEAEYGTITIEDNAGNTTECRVRVNLDWTAPSLTINAYKRQSDGSAGAKVGTVKATNTNKNVTLDKYTNGYGTDNWLNKANYPYGVYYEVIADDNVKIGTGAWSENAANLTKNNGKVNKLTEKAKKQFSKTDTKTNFNLVTEGYRTGKYVLKDQALNEVTINIVAPLDRTAPTNPTVGLYKKKSGTDISSSSGLSSYTNNTWLNGYVYTEAKGSTDSISQLDNYQYTTSGAVGTNTNKVGQYKNVNNEGTSNIKYRACDKAGNCTAFSSNYTIKLDRTAPTCTNVITYGGKTYSSGKWVNQDIRTSAKCSDSVSGCKSEMKVTSTGATQHVTKAKNTSFTVSQEGTSTTRWYVYDNAGNEGTCATVTEKIDKTKPTCTNVATYNGRNYSSGTWVNTNIYTTANCNDSLSGCSSTKKVTATGKYSYNKATYSSLTVQKEGTTTTKWYVYDAAGNEKDCSQITEKIDKTKPTCRIGTSFSANSSGWYRSNVGLTLTASDTGGSSLTGKGLTTSTSTTYNNKTTGTQSSETKQTTWYGYVKDGAGNTNVCSKVIKLDKSSPSCTNSGGSSNWTNRNVTITGRCTDSISGCKSSSVSTTLYQEGTYTNRSPGQVCDNAGNCKQCPYDRNAKIDKTPPYYTKVYPACNDCTNTNKIGSVYIYFADNLSGLGYRYTNDWDEKTSVNFPTKHFGGAKTGSDCLATALTWMGFNHQICDQANNCKSWNDPRVNFNC